MDSPIAPAATVDPATAPETTPVSVAASAPAERKTGFLARILGSESRIADLESAVAAEQAAHAQTREALATATARLAEFEALEAQLEAQATAAREQAAASEAAAATAAATAQAVPLQVAAAVRDVVASLGVQEDTLAPVSSEPAAHGEEFAHLTGRARAAAAFNAQFQK
jgi:hypothetical protein